MYQRERRPANGQTSRDSIAYNIPTDKITSISISARQHRITSRESLADSNALPLLLARCFVQPYATDAADPESWEGWAEYLIFGTLPRKSRYKTAGQICPFCLSDRKSTASKTGCLGIRQNVRPTRSKETMSLDFGFRQVAV